MKNGLFFALLLLVVLLTGCRDSSVPTFLETTNEKAETSSSIEVQSVDSPNTSVSEKVLYTITVAPSSSVINVGNCLTFSGIVKVNGNPVKGVFIGCEDPIKAMSLGKVATTDLNGKFTYSVESMCPAKYNSKSGKFTFKFYAGSSVVSSTVQVNTVPALASREFIIKNTSNKPYKVNLTVDGSSLGKTTISSKSSVRLLNDRQLKSSTFRATVYDINNKLLWSALFNNKFTGSTTSSTYQNPTLGNYFASLKQSIFGVNNLYTFFGSALGVVYQKAANKQFSVGGVGVQVSGQSASGVNYDAGATISGPGCSTFLGFKAACSASCDVSAGLQLCLGAGEGAAIGPISAGCTVNCCVTVASVSCQVVSVDIGASAIYK